MKGSHIALALALAFGSIAPASATEGDDPLTPEMPIGTNWSASTGIAPTAFYWDNQGIMADTLRGGWIEGQISFNWGTQSYDYADSNAAFSGYISSAELTAYDSEFRPIYLESKRKQTLCPRKWRFLCDWIDDIDIEIETSPEPPPPEDPTDRAITDGVALCIASKKAAIQSANQLVGICLARGGSASVDYGDACGQGMKVECTFRSREDQPDPEQ